MYYYKKIPLSLKSFHDILYLTKNLRIFSTIKMKLKNHNFLKKH